MDPITRHLAGEVSPSPFAERRGEVGGSAGDARLVLPRLQDLFGHGPVHERAETLARLKLPAIMAVLVHLWADRTPD
eukprot:765265-Pyramimonas_sp.AAC.1